MVHSFLSIPMSGLAYRSTKLSVDTFTFGLILFPLGVRRGDGMVIDTRCEGFDSMMSLSMVCDREDKSFISVWP